MPLISALSQPDDEVRKAVIEALAQLGDPAVTPLIAELKDQDPGVRRGAIQALAQIGDPRSAEPLIGARAA